MINIKLFSTLLKKRGFSNVDFAKQVGVSKSTVGVWLKGQEPLPAMQFKIATALAVNPAMLFPDEKKEIEENAVLKERIRSLETALANAMCERNDWKTQAQSLASMHPILTAAPASQVKTNSRNHLRKSRPSKYEPPKEIRLVSPRLTHESVIAELRRFPDSNSPEVTNHPHP